MKQYFNQPPEQPKKGRVETVKGILRAGVLAAAGLTAGSAHAGLGRVDTGSQLEGVPSITAQETANVFSHLENALYERFKEKLKKIGITVVAIMNTEDAQGTPVTVVQLVGPSTITYGIVGQGVKPYDEVKIEKVIPVLGSNAYYNEETLTPVIESMIEEYQSGGSVSKKDQAEMEPSGTYSNGWSYGSYDSRELYAPGYTGGHSDTPSVYDNPSAPYDYPNYNEGLATTEEGVHGGVFEKIDIDVDSFVSGDPKLSDLFHSKKCSHVDATFVEGNADVVRYALVLSFEEGERLVEVSVDTTSAQDKAVLTSLFIKAAVKELQSI